MFIVCEPISRGLEHVPFNAALLKTIRFAFPAERIEFYAEYSHVEEVKKEIGEPHSASIKWVNLTLPQRHSSFYRRLPSDFKKVKHLLDKINSNPSKNVLVITGNPSILWAVKYYVSTSYKNAKVQIVLHGDFSKLRYRPSLKLLLNPLYHVGSLKTALKFPPRIHFQIIVLEDAVREAVIKEIPYLQHIIKVLDHPIPSDSQPVKINNMIGPIQFGFLGSPSERKGFSKYLIVAADISKRFPSKAQFHFIGGLPDHYHHSNIPDLNFLAEKPNAQRLNRADYLQRLNKLHFVCLFYEKEYELTASGVLLDSIEYGKPIIASQLPIFQRLQDNFGSIGYLCNNGEFSEAIISIIEQNDFNRYVSQLSSINKIKHSRTPEVLSVKYRKLVEQFSTHIKSS